MNIENKNIQVATGSPRTISVHLVDAAGAPVTSGVAVELMLTAPLTGAPRIIPAVPQDGTYTITIPADLAPVTNPATGEPIPWHYALRAGASAAVARGSFLSGELHLLPAVLAGDLTSPISLAATYDPASASVSSAVFASDGLNEGGLVQYGLLKMQEVQKEVKMIALSGRDELIHLPSGVMINFAQPLTGGVTRFEFSARVAAVECSVVLRKGNQEISIPARELIADGYANSKDGFIYHFVYDFGGVFELDGVSAISLLFANEVELVAADAGDLSLVNGCEVIDGGILSHSDVVPAVRLYGLKTERVPVAATGGSRLNIQIRVMTEKNKMREETDASWRILDPQTTRLNLEWACAADAEMYWQVKDLYFYDGQSWRQSGWEIDVPVQKREIVLEEVECYRENLTSATGGAYVVDVRIFSYE